MPFDLESWKQWEGQSARGTFPLERCTGEGDRGAVFETRCEGRPAVIRIVPGTPESIDALGQLWKRAARLSHPALMRILASGETALGDKRCAYAVMERSDENLAEVLAERLLTPAETRAMLFPLLGALRYLHGKGFAHGGLKPANIMAFGEQLKISSDGLVPGGDAAADCAAIGVLLEEVLGAGPNAPLPEPFAEIARNCMAPDPSARWNAARIEACLRGDPAVAPAAPGRPRGIRWGVAAAAAAALGLFALWPSQTGSSHRNADAAPAVDATPPASAIPDGKPSPAVTAVARVAKKREPSPSLSTAPAEPVPASPPAGRARAVDGVTEVLPEIPQAALDTIRGRVRINVRVRVDSSGKVSQAMLEPPPASKYFCDRVLAAARAWNFPAGDAPRDWMLHFDLMRERTSVSLAKIGN